MYRDKKENLMPTSVIDIHWLTPIVIDFYPLFSNLHR